MLSPPLNKTRGWKEDPTSRYEYRWWSGLAWTKHVATNGKQKQDLPIAQVKIHKENNKIGFVQYFNSVSIIAKIAFGLFVLFVVLLIKIIVANNPQTIPSSALKDNIGITTIKNNDTTTPIYPTYWSCNDGGAKTTVIWTQRTNNVQGNISLSWQGLNMHEPFTGVIKNTKIILTMQNTNTDALGKFIATISPNKLIFPYNPIIQNIRNTTICLPK